MSLSTIFAVIVVPDLLVLAGLAFVMTRVKFLTPHVSAQPSGERASTPEIRVHRLPQPQVGIDGALVAHA